VKKLVALIAVVAVVGIAASAPAATRTVRVADNVFRPSSLTARVGDTLRFRWVGRAPHNVRVARGPQRFSASTRRRGTFSVRVRRAGSYRIVCTIHPGMDMRLRVRR
jgi:plastocyanin